MGKDIVCLDSFPLDIQDPRNAEYAGPCIPDDGSRSWLTILKEVGDCLQEVSYESGNSVNLLCLGIVIPLLLLSGCATTKGKVSDGSYHAPLGNFVLPVDRGNIRIQDKNDARSGMVSVLDDMGNNEGITYVSLPANAEAVHNDPAKMDSAYRGFVHDYALPALFRPVSAQSKNVHEEFLGSGLDRAFFAVAVIPEASSVMDGKTGKRRDSVRALLVFDKNKFMYMLHSEINTVFDPVNAASLTKSDLGAARSKMLRMRGSVRFQ